MATRSIDSEDQDLIPLAEGSLLAGVSYHRLQRLVYIRTIRGERRAGKWLCSRTDVIRWATARDAAERVLAGAQEG